MKKENSMYWIIGIVLILAIIASVITCKCWNVLADTLLLFWGSLVWGIATLIAVVYSVENNWKQQSAILKQEIKIQLFDKRYSVFNALVRAMRFVNREDINLIAILDVLNIHEMRIKLHDFNEEIKEKTDLSQTIFDKNIHDKMLILSKYYQEIFVNFLKLPFKANETLKKPNAEEAEIIRKKMYEGNYDLSDIFPNAKSIISEWGILVEKFNKYFIECGIIDDFDEYLMIKNMDKFDDGKN